MMTLSIPLRHYPRLVSPVPFVSSRRYTSNVSASRANLFPSVEMTTGQHLNVFCKKYDLKVRTETLPSSSTFLAAQLHSLEISNAAKTGGALLYFHGGGYTYPAGSGHFKFSTKLARRLKCRQLHILQYSLLPLAKYPTQLGQAVDSLIYLLRDFAPSQLAIAGDSAGGNMVLGLLAHLKTAHPDIKSVEMSSPLAAAICISPRCSNDTTAQSFIDNAEKDVIDAAGLASFVEKWQPVDGHVWASANCGGKAFWNSGDSIRASKMLIVAGGDEVYLDDIQEFAKLVSAKSPDGENAARQFVVAPNSVHVQAVIDHAMGVENGPMTEAILNWADKNPITAGPKD